MSISMAVVVAMAAGCGDGDIVNPGNPTLPEDFITLDQCANPKRCVAAVKVADAHACVLLVDGSVWCWGSNAVGAIDSSSAVSPATTLEAPNRHSTIEQAAGMETRYSSSCAVGVFGSCAAACWGAALQSASPSQIADDPGAVVLLPVDLVRLAVGVGHVCGLSTRGDAYCIGNNEYGQLGYTGLTNPVDNDARSAGLGSPTLNHVAGFENGADIVAGFATTCAVDRRGSVWCWGKMSYALFGETGDTVLQEGSTKVPTRIEGVDDVALLDMATSYACGILKSGIVVCWGTPKIGSGSAPYTVVWPPREFPLPSRAIALSTGEDAACAVVDTGEVYCWGLNTDGLLGFGSADPNSHATPSRVPGVNAAIDVSVGGQTACAVTAEGKLLCWGRNASGLLGGTVVRGGVSDPVEIQW